MASKYSTLHRDFNKKTTIADFEQAIHFTIVVCPSILLVGYRFYLSQAWWRIFKVMGYKQRIKTLILK